MALKTQIFAKFIVYTISFIIFYSWGLYVALFVGFSQIRSHIVEY